MGREVYDGDVGEKLYDRGVYTGAMGLMLNSVVLGFASPCEQIVVRGIDRVKILWGTGNLLLAIYLAMIVLITKIVEHSRRIDGGVATIHGTFTGIKIGVLALFVVLRIPLSFPSF